MTRAVTFSEIFVQSKWGDKGHLVAFQDDHRDQDECYPRVQKEFSDLV